MKHIMMTILVMSVGVAYWTGKAERFTSVTGKAAIKCEYSYAGRNFWMSFIANSCPSSVEVQ